MPSPSWLTQDFAQFKFLTFSQLAPIVNHPRSPLLTVIGLSQVNNNNELFPKTILSNLIQFKCNRIKRHSSRLTISKSRDKTYRQGSGSVIPNRQFTRNETLRKNLLSVRSNSVRNATIQITNKTAILLPPPYSHWSGFGAAKN